MKRLLFVAALAACSSPPAVLDAPATAPPPATVPASLTTLPAALQRATATRQTFAAASLTLPPLTAETLVSGQCSVVVTGHLGTQKTRAGRWIVCVPGDGSARVTRIDSEVGPAWSALNVPGTNLGNLPGQTVAVPLSVTPGDKLIVMSGSAGGNPAPSYWFAGTSSTIDEAMSVVFVSYDVRKDVVGELLAGPSWGSRNPINDFLSNSPWPVSYIDWGRLVARISLDDLYQIPGVPRPGDQFRIDPTQWGCARPSIDDHIAFHSRFDMDCYSGWACAGRVPYLGHQGYGTFVLAKGGEGMLLCFTTLPFDKRQTLALALCQRAIDTLGGLVDGTWRYPSGGHCWGRRGPLVLLGHLFAIDIYADPTPFVGARLPEDQLVTVTSWWGQPNWTGYHFSLATPANLWATHPGTWGDRNDPTHASNAWQVSYGGQVIPAMVATAAAITAMEREASAPLLVNVVRCWTNGPPAAARAELEARGINLAFGEDYAVQKGFAVAAWRALGN